MSHLPTVGRKHWKSRFYLFSLYILLSFMAITMVVPFLITVGGSATNDFDYQRFSPVPRFLYSQEDRYVKELTKYFNNYRGWDRQFRAYYTEAPAHWSSWMKIGENTELSDEFALKYLKVFRSDRERQEFIAQDYSEFMDTYPMMDTQVSLEQIEAIEFLRQYYTDQYLQQHPEAKNLSNSDLRAASLKLLSDTWQTPYATYYAIKFRSESKYPMEFQSWYPPAMDPKYADYLKIKDAYRKQMFVPGLEDQWLEYAQSKGLAAKFPIAQDADQKTLDTWQQFKAQQAPASMVIPFALRAEWYRFLSENEIAQNIAGIALSQKFTIAEYNQLAGTNYTQLNTTPFPIPQDFGPKMQELWKYFVKNKYPLRLSSFEVTAETQKLYTQFIEKEIKVIRIANELIGTNHDSWDQFQVTGSAPEGFSKEEQNARSIWMNFIKSLELKYHQKTSSEIAYQKFLTEKYGNVEKVNQTYGWELARIEEAFPPLATAYTSTFLKNEGAMTKTPVLKNYRMIFDFLILNGKALGVTFILVLLTIIATLTINPICAYSLSRFNLPGQSKVILFMLATMAFPAMVSAIPAYLLMRDLGMLNTFTTLVLPGAANGMAIFILKGFFDSLPQELYEAATIDGASEMQIFKMVAMPMVKPILAINCVSAFIGAYNGWEWALIICQDQDMWTLAVWMYQASQWWKESPWIVSAGFVVISIPTMIVFLSTQKIILKGIVVPSMK
ncbi:ABC transporter, permease protein [Lentisphaera araneosa HTCC2155]|uniref:sn-glycerol-3-phosphate transport system permease protein UgpE n=1 Tax=Lentisphaera araneosa HTCC2155 TaxID=313628 RepID=A6DLU7_9BACT|nr:carbohydrate ABC transporter permease [Lentisphaera araneosa]EDM27245.1 ABC transporter, permease protein [Lentisphaera araneosa HTCC2155]